MIDVPATESDGPDGPSTRSAHKLVFSRELSFPMEAHDALSAAVAERAEFRELWASGLSIASSFGYRLPAAVLNVRGWDGSPQTSGRASRWNG